MRNLLLTTVLLMLALSPALAQQAEGNPFKRLGYKASVYTFGDDKEFHDQETIVEIGNVLYNTETKEVVGFIEDQDSLIELKPELQSMSIDPHCEKYYSITPYAYCMNNPVRFIDPDGRDWVEDKEGKIVWNDKATSIKNTPGGSIYIGNNDALLGHLGMTNNFPEQSSNWIGQFVIDENTLGTVNLKVRNSIRIEVNEKRNINQSIETNKLGRVFKGVDVIATSVSSDTGVDGEMLAGSIMEVNYGGTKYEQTLSEIAAPYVIEAGTNVKIGTVTIPVSHIKSNIGTPKIQMVGNWWVSKPEGKVPIGIIGTRGAIPISYKHKWPK